MPASLVVVGAGTTFAGLAFPSRSAASLSRFDVAAPHHQSFWIRILTPLSDGVHMRNPKYW